MCGGVPPLSEAITMTVTGTTSISYGAMLNPPPPPRFFVDTFYCPPLLLHDWVIMGPPQGHRINVLYVLPVVFVAAASRRGGGGRRSNLAAAVV